MKSLSNEHRNSTVPTRSCGTSVRLMERAWRRCWFWVALASLSSSILMVSPGAMAFTLMLYSPSSRDIDLHRQGLLPTRAQRLGHRLSATAVNIGHHYTRPFAGQTFTVGTPNAMRPASDNNHPLLKSPHGSSSCLRPT